MNLKELPEILTITKASKVLSCHPNTLRNWANEGKIKFIRFGKRGDRRFKKDEILKLLKEYKT